MTRTCSRIMSALATITALALIASACSAPEPEPDPKSRVAMTMDERASIANGEYTVEPVWTVDLDAFGWVSVVGEHVLSYVLEPDGAFSLVALAASDGTEEWRIPVVMAARRAENMAVGPHSDGEVVMLFQERDGTRAVVLVDVATGEERASRTIDAALAPAMCDIERLCLVLPSDEAGAATAYSVDPATAELQPTLAPYTDRAEGRFLGSRVLMLEQHPSLLVGLNEETGEREWGKQVTSFVGTGGDAWPMSAWEVGDALLLEWSDAIWPRHVSVVETDGSGVTALNRTDGRELWRRSGVLRCAEFICTGDARLVQEGDTTRYKREIGTVVLEWVDLTGTTVWSDEVDFTWLNENADALTFDTARHLHPYADGGIPMVFDDVAKEARPLTADDVLACFVPAGDDRPDGDRHGVTPCTIEGAAPAFTRALVEDHAYADDRVADDAPERHRVIRTADGLALYDLP